MMLKSFEDPGLSQDKSLLQDEFLANWHELCSQKIFSQRYLFVISSFLYLSL